VVHAAVALVAADPGGGWGQVPAVADDFPDHVAGTVVPSRFDQQPRDVLVAGLGGRPLGSGAARGVLGGNQSDEGADGAAGEPAPVADLIRVVLLSRAG
jgi:hypothetical protein